MHDSTDIIVTIVKRLKERDEKALEYLYEHYSAALYGVILRTLGNEQASEEVLQDVFIKIWEQIESYEPKKGKLFTWMYRIARNNAIDVRRSKEFKFSGKSIALDSFVDNLGKPTGNDEHGLKEIVDQLDTTCTKLIKMNFFMGFSHKDISEQLLIPLGTIKTRIRSCMGKLRNLMEKI